MELEKIFKQIILLDLVLSILIIVLFFFQPTEILTISETLDSGVLEPISDTIMFFLFLLSFLIFYLVSLFLLYKFMDIGKMIFLIMTIVSLILSLTMGPTIASPLISTLEWLGGASHGAILVLLYFSPIKDKFIN